MTTPKSPEEIMKEFERTLHNFISPSNCDCCEKMGSGHNMAHLYSGEIRDFLRSSMASLLLYIAERLGELSLDQIPELEGDDEMDCRIRDAALDDCRILLTNEARKIMEV